MMSLLIKNALALYTCDANDRVYRNAYVLTENNRIRAIGEGECPLPADRVIDASGCVVLPGFINLHHHFFQSVTRAVPFAQRTKSMDWLHRMYPLWLELEPDDMYWASIAAAGELLLTGATTCADLSYLMPALGNVYADAQVRAVRELGLRFHLVRGSTVTIEGELEERLRPLLGNRIGALVDPEDQVIPQAKDALRRFHDPSEFSMLRVDLGPTGVTYAKPKMMRAYADLARDAGCGLHTHYHPRQEERDRSQALTGFEAMEFLRQSGWVGERTWFAHCTGLNDAEIATFANAGIGIAHCPRTVVRLGYHVTRISAMRRAGVAIGMGVDGSSSNDTGSMISDMRLGLLLHRVNVPLDEDVDESWMTPYDMLLMATRNGARILGRSDIGSLEVGKAADIAGFNVMTLPHAGGLADPLGGLLMTGADARARFVVVDGKPRVEDGRLVGVAEERLAAEINRAADRMLDAAQRNTGIDFRRYPRSAAEAATALRLG